MAETRHLPELTQVRDAHRIELSRLSEYFAAHLPQLGGALTARQFKDGQSNPTFLLQSGAQQVVLRKKPPGDLLPGAHRIEREFRIISALASHGVPVPKALHLCEDDSVIGTPFYVMENVEGRVCQNPVLTGMTAAERTAIYASMAGVLAQLHRINWKTAGLGDYGKHESFIERQIALWSHQYEAAKTGDIADMDRLMEWLPRNIPEDGETTLVHGDFRLGNLILSSHAPRVAAVLDWELSTLGHPLTDLAYNCLPYHLATGDDSLPGLAGVDLDALGIPDEKAHVEAYCRAAGRDDGIQNWPFYITFAMFRLASISQGVYARALKGNASSANAMGFGERAMRLAEFAWRNVDES
ncbi:MAG: phosphotransferase family protein [Proteobacteria bacterium]|nr:phosphotransferase family protein [Pseudomonadota bacterium]MDA1357961.1 phosphotransferase family protein [Pseudomonadota bacterium]